MSTRLAAVDLTSFGCPLYYIKAREVMQAAVEDIIFRVNTGVPTDDVVRSLTQDGFSCTVTAINQAYNQIRVSRHDST